MKYHLCLLNHCLIIYSAYSVFQMEGKGDAWTKYMAEVKKYKAHQCGDDDKTRPLVK